MIERKIDLFQVLELETRSTCNRVCPTCIRNSEPDREAVKSWFEPNNMPKSVFDEAIRQVARMNYRGPICLSHYNEPLQDDRIVDFVKDARVGCPELSEVFFHSNGDFLTEELAHELDAHLSRMTVALYMDEPKKSERAAWIKTLFKATRIEFTGGVHIPTHFSPAFPVDSLARAHRTRPCSEPQGRMVLNHRGQMMLCCDDVIGRFGLGTFPEQSIEELWFGEKHQQIVLDLKQRNGRLKYPYCETCPRP